MKLSERLEAYTRSCNLIKESPILGQWQINEIKELESELENADEERQFYYDVAHDTRDGAMKQLANEIDRLHKELEKAKASDALKEKALDMCVATISNDFDIEYGRGEIGGAQYWLDKAKEVKA